MIRPYSSLRVPRTNLFIITLEAIFGLFLLFADHWYLKEIIAYLTKSHIFLKKLSVLICVDGSQKTEIIFEKKERMLPLKNGFEHAFTTAFITYSCTIFLSIFKFGVP